MLSNKQEMIQMPQHTMYFNTEDTLIPIIQLNNYNTVKNVFLFFSLMLICDILIYTFKLVYLYYLLAMFAK